jgi:hypothetical protein
MWRDDYLTAMLAHGQGMFAHAIGILHFLPVPHDCLFNDDLAPDAEGHRRIRFPPDALSGGGWRARRRGRCGSCRTRRRDDISDSPVFRVDQQDIIVVKLGIFEAFGGRNAIGNIGGQLAHWHGLRYRRADPGQESYRGGFTSVGLDALHDGLFLLSR